MSYLIRRLLQALLTMLGVAVVVFGLLHLSGDPAVMMSAPDATPDQVVSLRRSLGLDQPLLVQLGVYLWHLATFDLGMSLRFNRAVTGLIADRLPNTLELTLAAMLIAIAVALPAGIIAAVHRGRMLDRLLMAGALAGQAVPIFWLGLILVRVFAVDLHILPVYGQGGLSHLVLPAVTLATIIMGRLARLTRSSMLEVLGRDHVRTARAKGLTELRVLLRHGLRNAAMPLVTLLGLQLAQLLGGAVVTETIFAWPGVGGLVVEAVFNRDFPIVQGVTLVVSAIFVLANLAVDLSYLVLDPRVRLGA